MGIITENNIQYSGAGALVVEDYYRKNGTVEPCIVLVRNKASGEYSDFGGSYEAKHGSLQVTASTELREESRNLLNISPKYMTNKVDIPTSKDHYRVYLLKVNGINRKYFLHNSHSMDTLHKSGVKVPRSWRETNDIVHIPIKNIDFTKLHTMGSIIVRDVDNKSIKLVGRAKRVIRYAKDKILSLSRLKVKPIASRKDIIIHKSKTPWTNNTFSYVLG